MILFRSRVINQEHEPLYNKGLSQTSETDYDLNQVRTYYILLHSVSFVALLHCASKPFVQRKLAIYTLCLSIKKAGGVIM